MFWTKKSVLADKVLSKKLQLLEICLANFPSVSITRDHDSSLWVVAFTVWRWYGTFFCLCCGWWIESSFEGDVFATNQNNYYCFGEAELKLQHYVAWNERAQNYPEWFFCSVADVAPFFACIGWWARSFSPRRVAQNSVQRSLTLRRDQNCTSWSKYGSSFCAAKSSPNISRHSCHRIRLFYEKRRSSAISIGSLLQRARYFISCSVL